MTAIIDDFAASRRKEDGMSNVIAFTKGRNNRRGEVALDRLVDEIARVNVALAALRHREKAIMAAIRRAVGTQVPGGAA